MFHNGILGGERLRASSRVFAKRRCGLVSVEERNALMGLARSNEATTAAARAVCGLIVEEMGRDSGIATPRRRGAVRRMGIPACWALCVGPPATTAERMDFARGGEDAMFSFGNATNAAAMLGGVKHAELLEENCAIARAGAIVGERWVWVILRQAFNGARRFEEFHRGIGLARNVLADRLEWLVTHGIFERRPYGSPSARDLNEYRLTAKGHALFPIYVSLMQWGNEWTGLPAPPVDLLHKPCGHRVRPRVVCPDCDADIDAHDTEPVVGRGLIMHRRGRR